MKRLNIFKPSDFERTVMATSLSELRADLNKFEASDRANKILNEWLKENSVRVTGQKNISNGMTYSTTFQKSDTHTALLICIEPIKKCEHKEAVYVESHPNKTWFECRDCGKALKPKGWEEEK